MSEVEKVLQRLALGKDYEAEVEGLLETMSPEEITEEHVEEMRRAMSIY